MAKVITCGALFVAVSAVSLQAQDYVETDEIVYKTVGGRALMLDIESPLPKGIARPAIIFLCGNGFGYYKSINRTEFSYALDLATANGFVGITVDYSSYQESSNKRAIGTFPEQIYDVKSAIRFLRAHARQFDIDPWHIGILGQSSGGNLALLAGLTRPSDGLEGNDDFMQYSSAVQAVVNFAGPIDLVSEAQADPAASDPYIGGSLEALPEQFKKASPITFVRPDGPPVLSIHGDNDSEVSINETFALDEKMKKLGEAHTLVVKKGGGHMDFNLEDPLVWDFFAKELKEP